MLSKHQVKGVKNARDPKHQAQDNIENGVFGGFRFKKNCQRRKDDAEDDQNKFAHDVG